MYQFSYGFGIRNWTVLNQIPPELSDGNWYAKYDFDSVNNILISTAVSQLRDNSLLNVESANIIPAASSSFDTDGTGYWGASGTKTYNAATKDMTVTATANGQHYIYKAGSICIANGVFRLKFRLKSDTITGALNVSLQGAVTGSNLCVAIKNPSLTTVYQDYEFIFIANYFIFFGVTIASATTGQSFTVDDIVLTRVTGNHLVKTVNNQPTKGADYITFNGTSNYLLTAAGVASIGTVYAKVKRVGTDSDFVMLNDLTGLGQYASNVLTFGANSALSSFYSLQIKSLYIRSVTDDAATIARLNAFFLNEQIITDAMISEDGSYYFEAQDSTNYLKTE